VTEGRAPLVELPSLRSAKKKFAFSTQLENALAELACLRSAKKEFAFSTQLENALAGNLLSISTGNL